MATSPLLPSPTEIVRHLDRFVFGQAQAKQDVATAVYNHYLGLAVRDSSPAGPSAPFGPQHLLLLGPTGTGKSFLIRTLAAFLGVPFSFTSATSLAQTGYAGNDADGMVRDLYARAGNDVAAAERGIIFVDEIDKIRRHARGDGGPDVSGEGAQIGLLTLLDGSPVPIRPPHRDGPDGDIDTSRILFVFGGAFVGLEDIIDRRLGHDDEVLGFRTSNSRDRESRGARLPQVEDLVEFGLIPELIGRLATWSILDPLGVDDLVQILLNQEDSILARKILFWKKHGIDLEFTPNALREVAQRSLVMGTGARALNRFVEGALDDVDWRPVDLMREGVRRIVIHSATVRREAEPEIVRGTAPSDEQALETLRREAFHPSSAVGDFDPPRGQPGISDIRGWSEDDVRSRIDTLKAKLQWDATSGSARRWWSQFENDFQDRLPVILRLVEELAVRKATISEFFQAYVYSNTENIQANLYYLDYTRLKKKEEEKERKARAEAARRNAEDAVTRAADQKAAPETAGTSSTAPCPSCKRDFPVTMSQCPNCGASRPSPADDA